MHGAAGGLPWPLRYGRNLRVRPAYLEISLQAITDNIRKARFIEQQMVMAFIEHGVKSRSIVTSVDAEGTRLID